MRFTSITLRISFLFGILSISRFDIKLKGFRTTLADHRPLLCRGLIDEYTFHVELVRNDGSCMPRLCMQDKYNSSPPPRLPAGLRARTGVVAFAISPNSISATIESGNDIEIRTRMRSLNRRCVMYTINQQTGDDACGKLANKSGRQQTSLSGQRGIIVRWLSHRSNSFH